MTNNYFCDIDTVTLDIDQVREDFETIFNANAIDVEVIKQLEDPQNNATDNADFFGTDSPRKHYVKREKLFITSELSKGYRRDNQGIMTTNQTLKAYARWDADFKPTDLIKIIKTPKNLCGLAKKGQIFKIDGNTFNAPMYEGQYAWQEFNLIRVDKE